MVGAIRPVDPVRESFWLRRIQGFERILFFQQPTPLSPYHFAVASNHQERRRYVGPVFANQLVRNGIPDVQPEKLNLVADFALKCANDWLGCQAGRSSIGEELHENRTARSDHVPGFRIARHRAVARLEGKYGYNPGDRHPGIKRDALAPAPDGKQGEHRDQEQGNGDDRRVLVDEFDQICPLWWLPGMVRLPVRQVRFGRCG